MGTNNVSRSGFIQRKPTLEHSLLGTLLCWWCVSGQREAADPPAGRGWPLSIGWTQLQGLGVSAQEPWGGDPSVRAAVHVSAERGRVSNTCCAPSQLHLLNLATVSVPLLISSVQVSRSVVSGSLRPHGLQHARPPRPSPTPGVYPNSCPSSW